jgi:hypothetical protein
MTDYRTDAPPMDGSEIVVPCKVVLTVYWDEQLKAWILTRPLHIERFSGEISKWKPK